MTHFDCFVGIDWSGNKEKWQRGLKIALARPGSDPPKLVDGPSPKLRWSRTSASCWIKSLVEKERALIGVDFAFGFPSVRKWLPTTSLDWEYVERICNLDGNFYGGQFFRNKAAAHADLVTGPWFTGAKHKIRPLRRTENTAKEITGATPQSVFVAIGAAQVGMASVSGMRMLRCFKEDYSEFVSIWPFDEPDAKRSVIVEIFPRYFPLSKGLSPKLKDHALLNQALKAFGSASVRAPPESEDEGDALLSAAALRCLSSNKAMFALPDISIRNEGWIFGVPLGGAA